ncbi:dTDP-4-dehydrorhamnose reductase [Xaviernesmea oryzae]|nr:dTDP-4-dehydrorhamnose reductase [Xaviernesmea oryzae]
MAPRRLLVTGHEGQVVRALREKVKERHDLELVTIGRPQFDLAFADRAAILRHLHNTSPDLVISAAAFTAVDQAEAMPDVTFRVNRDAPTILAAEAHRLALPIIHLSTDYVFNGTKQGLYTEDDEPEPLNIYGMSKLAGEEGVRAVNPDHVILRTSWLYGPSGTNFVRTMLRLAATRPVIDVVCDQQGSPTSTLDLADAILAVAERLLARPDADFRGTFHIAGPGQTTWAEFARAIFSHSRGHGGPGAEVRDIAAAVYKARALRPANSRLDCRKLARVYGLTLPSWQDSLDPVVTAILAETDKAAR